MSHAYNWRKHRIKQGRYESPWERHCRVMCDFSAQLEKLMCQHYKIQQDLITDEIRDCAAVERK